ncbi:MAG: hypothetical protein LUE99_05335 [Bacteroides sp.]|nr:hypothetical protein [Bacteroides sp.]
MIEGDYSGQIEVTKRIPVSAVTRAATESKDITVTLGTFPTTKGMRSAYRLRLYKEGGEEPLYNGTVIDTLTVRRNQLLNVDTRFREGSSSFEVVVNTTWDGSIPGGC